MPYRFRIKLAKSGGYFWDFVASNNEIVCASQVYSTKEACVRGMSVVAAHGGTAERWDHTDEPAENPAA